MGWQSPQPGHQSAGSLRKHLRELGRQLKGADRHYRKVTQSTVPRPAGAFLQTLLAHSGYQHGPLGHPQHHGPRTELGSASHCCSCSPSSPPARPEHPPLQSHSHPSRLAPSHRCHRLSHSQGARRGSPAYKNHTTSQQLHSTHSPQSRGKQTPLRSSHTALPEPRATGRAASQSRRGQANPSPGHPATSAWPPHLPAISIGFSLFRLSLLPASEICAPKAALRSRSVSLPVLRDLQRVQTT